MRLWIEAWRKDNEEQYYGLSRDEVSHILSHYEDAIDEIEGLRKALGDVADYQHRWSESPIREVQKIARQALGKEMEI